jgi:nitrate/nitrite transport system ATP-binding protein
VLSVAIPRPRDRIALAAQPDYVRAREAVLRFLYERHRFVEAAE